MEFGPSRSLVQEGSFDFLFQPFLNVLVVVGRGDMRLLLLVEVDEISPLRLVPVACLLGWTLNHCVFAVKFCDLVLFHSECTVKFIRCIDHLFDTWQVLIN